MDLSEEDLTYMIKVKPYLPEPTRQPATFLADTSDCLFMQRRLLAGSIEIYNGQ